MDSKKPLYKSISFWIMVLFLLYSTLGFFAVPYFVKKELNRVASDTLNSQLSIVDINFNPYTISLDILELKLNDKDSTLWFSADKVHVNLHLWLSLFKNPSLAKVHIQEPYFHLKTIKINDSIQLKYPQINYSSDEPNEVSELLLNIDDIGIDRGSVTYDDESGNKHVNLNIKEILFRHQQFTTADNDSDFNLSFITENNAETQLSGKFNFSTLSLSTNWKLSNWSTSTLFNFISDENNKLLGFENKSGIINADGSLSYSSFQDTLPSLLINALQLTEFSTNTSDKSQPSISLPMLSLNTIEINLDKQSINVDSIDSQGAEIGIHVTKDYELVTQASTQTPNQVNDSASELDWSYHIKRFNSNNSQLQLVKESDVGEQLNKLDFDKITVSNFTNIEQQEADINISVKADDQGQIKMQAKLQVQPFTIDSQITFSDTNIAKWQAWVPEDINLTIDQGFLSLQQNLTIQDNHFISQGSFLLNNITLLDNDKQPFLAINSLDLSDSYIDSKQKKARLNNIKLDQAQGTLRISDKQQLNIDTIVSRNDMSTVDEEKETKNDDWVIEIDQIEFLDSQTNLIDKSIKPNYHTELSRLNGSIKGLSSNNLSKADVELSAILDTYANINIQGQINPLSDNAYTDLSINIENLNLQNFSSYSGQFLGFPITRGKADFELNYKLNQNLLKGVNNLTFKQLQFGDKNQSKDAINLPLKLAVNLLTDGKGIMNINLPVSGNIDDPEFSYGGLVFKAFFKLITGIVASPFKLLGKLIPGGADLDLSGIQFKAGSTTLELGEEAKLDAMKQIIKQRPAIILELTGITNSINDTKALQLQSLLTALNITALPDFNEKSIQTAIEQLYISTFTQEKWQLLSENATKDQILNNQLLTENGWNELLQTQNIKEPFDQLAKQRAQYIQQQLIEKHSISQDKIFLKSGEQSEELMPQVKFGIGS